jgi:DNA topoisomerase-1
MEKAKRRPKVMTGQTKKSNPKFTPEPGNDVNRLAARSAGLIYVSDQTKGITRKKSGAGWRYIGPDGKTMMDRMERRRIEKIGVPPAYEDVWICSNPDGHIQATGRDARGRKQYRYHVQWTEIRDSVKFERMLVFGAMLPAIRARIISDMAKQGLPREKVLATVVNLLDTTLIRIGNEDYARDNKSFGLTTLRNRHVAFEGSMMRFQFKGKSGKVWSLGIHDRRVTKIVKAIQELPGQRLFQYIDEAGERQPIDSADVNAYLRDITGEDVTAKDFRTWAGTVLAAMALREFAQVDSNAALKKNVKAAIEKVAARLGNTPAICRKCYIHPLVLNSYLNGNLLIEVKQEVETELGAPSESLRPEEAALLGLLSRRISRDLKQESAV